MQIRLYPPLMFIFFGIGLFSQISGLEEGVSEVSFGTKTSYDENLKLDAHSPIPWNIPQGYSTIYLDIVFRHGTRYPNPDKIKQWKHHISQMNGPFIENSKKLWDLHFADNTAYKLHHVGMNELSQIATRVFHTAFLSWAKNATVQLEAMTSPKIRSKESACSFIHTLKKEKDNFASLNPPNSSGSLSFRWKKSSMVAHNNDSWSCSGIPVEINSSLLRSFDSCQRYNITVKGNSSSDSEIRKFTSSIHAMKVVRRVSTLLRYNLTWNEVESLYQICAFQYALYNYKTLCEIFKYSRQVMEYHGDLKHYYKTGYGYDINYKLSCPLLSDIVARMDAVANGTADFASPVGVFRFGHAETVIPLLCALGLYKDSVPLTSDSYHRHANNRRFRTGSFSPFAANVMFVLYRPTHSNAGERGRIKFSLVVNERVVQLPRLGCHFCFYAEVKRAILKEYAVLDCSSVCRVRRSDSDANDKQEL